MSSDDFNQPAPVTQTFAFPPERQKAIEVASANRAKNERASPAVMQKAMAAPISLNGQPMTVGQSIDSTPKRALPQPSAMAQAVNASRSAPTRSAQSEPVVANHMPVITEGLADGEYSSLALPSRFHYYGFKDLYAKPFGVPHLAKLSRAHKEKSLQPVIESVSSVLRTSTPGFENVPLGFILNVPDFFFVMYWLRLNSYTKSNYVHKTKCNNPEHIAQVKANILPPESLDITKIVTKTDIVIQDLEEIPDPAVFHFSEDSPMIFRPALMKDTLEFMDDPLFANPATREEFAFSADLASFIQHESLQLPLADRVNIINAASPDDAQLIADFQDLVKDFGVNEYINVTCKECGASRVTKLAIDAHAFLPTHRSAGDNGTQAANRVGV